MKQTNRGDGLTLRPNESKEQFWRDTLQQFRGSGQTVRAFCKQRGLTEPSFYAWRRTIAERDGKYTAPSSKQAKFVELRAQQPANALADAPLEVVAGSRRLLIRSGCDRALLRDVLAALEGGPSKLEA